jgi:CRISPR-associated protein (TIGR03986 family)
VTTFYNPYNFIPTPDRGDKGARLPEGLRDDEPPGHHRWHKGLWSGDIAITIRTITPLLLTREPETAANTTRRAQERHRHLEIVTADDGTGTTRVDLAPTQIKGMLRAAYEAVTNSRFGVFEQQERLGYRSEVSSAAKLRPALVMSPSQVRLLGELCVDGIWLYPSVTVAAWDRVGTSRTWRLGGLAHGDEVEAAIVLDEFTAGRQGQERPVRRWRAEAVRKPGGKFVFCAERSGKTRYLVKGYLHATGPTIEGKHAERIFVTDIVDGKKGALRQDDHVDINGSRASELISLLVQLKDHQRQIHQSATGDEIWDRKDDQERTRQPWEYLDDDPGQTAWARHLYDTAGLAGVPAWTGLDFAIPNGGRNVPLTCWAEPSTNRPRPVMVSRLLSDHDQAELLRPSVRPAAIITELSPADRVFGWVVQESSTKRPKKRRYRTDGGAHRGQLRVVHVESPPAADAIEQLNPPLTIEPLSTPKPSQGRFYLGKDTPGGLQPLGANVRKEAFFQPPHVLRGRKVYPHQPRLVGKNTRQLRGLLRYQPPQGRKEQDSQNATLHQWIRPKVEFRAVLRVDNLNDLELGALLWLLDPARLGIDGKPGYFKLGGGKPLGFGSIKITIDKNRTALTTGTNIAVRLRNLQPVAGPADWSQLAARFEQAMAGQFGDVIDAVRRAAAGYPAEIDVHYPRPHPRAHGYEWFVRNEKTNTGMRCALPLLGDPPLPKSPTKPPPPRRSR